MLTGFDNHDRNGPGKSSRTSKFVCMAEYIMYWRHFSSPECEIYWDSTFLVLEIHDRFLNCNYPRRFTSLYVRLASATRLVDSHLVRMTATMLSRITMHLREARAMENPDREMTETLFGWVVSLSLADMSLNVNTWVATVLRENRVCFTLSFYSWLEGS